MSLEYVVYLLGIIACALILVRTIKNYKILNDKYDELQVSICLSHCQNSLFKSVDFFYMKNSGGSLCETLENIEYVDYIGDCSLFMERKYK